MYYTVVIVACCAGSIITASTSLPAFMVFINISLLPLIAKCFWEQETVLVFLGYVIIFLYYILIRLSRKQNDLLLETISLKIENKNYSLKDPMTSLWNRRRLSLFIEKLIPASHRSNKPFSIIILDIDRFKEYNDSRGHSAGDSLIIQIAGIIQECSREQDLVVRYGGEEFMLVLPSTNINQAKIITERILITVKENTDVTISAGLTAYSGEMNFDQLVQQADKALYAAKETGRNRFIATETG